MNLFIYNISNNNNICNVTCIVPHGKKMQKCCWHQKGAWKRGLSDEAWRYDDSQSQRVKLCEAVHSLQHLRCNS